MIDSLANRLAITIKNANEDQTVSIPVMEYALIIIFNTVFTAVIALLVGSLVGKLPETTLCLVSFALLRFVSGGYHLKSSDACTLVSAGIIILVPFIPITANWVVLLTIVSLILAVIYAPSGLNGRTRIPEKYLPLLKLLSIVIIASNFIFLSGLLAITFTIQSLSLITLRKEDVT